MLSFSLGNLGRDYSQKTPSCHVVREALRYTTASYLQFTEFLPNLQNCSVRRPDGHAFSASFLSSFASRSSSYSRAFRAS